MPSAPSLISTGAPVPGSAPGIIGSVSNSMPPQQALFGWNIAIRECAHASAVIRCSLSVTNSTSEKRGFRLENVHAMRGGDIVGKAKDFYYYPRASFGMDATEGKCDASASCLVQLSLPDISGLKAGTPSSIDAISFSLSIWGGFGAGAKIMESDVIRMTLPTVH